MPAALAAAGPCSVTSCPDTVSVPLSGGYTPARILTRVDLPAPFSPRSACTSPARSSTDPSTRARTAPKDFSACRSASTGCPSPASAGGPASSPAASTERTSLCGGFQQTLVERFNFPVVSVRPPGVSIAAPAPKLNRYSDSGSAPSVSFCVARSLYVCEGRRAQRDRYGVAATVVPCCSRLSRPDELRPAETGERRPLGLAGAVSGASDGSAPRVAVHLLRGRAAAAAAGAACRPHPQRRARIPHRRGGGDPRLRHRRGQHPGSVRPLGAGRGAAVPCRDHSRAD